MSTSRSENRCRRQQQGASRKKKRAGIGGQGQKKRPCRHQGPRTHVDVMTPAWLPKKKLDGVDVKARNPCRHHDIKGKNLKNHRKSIGFLGIPCQHRRHRAARPKKNCRRQGQKCMSTSVSQNPCRRHDVGPAGQPKKKRVDIRVQNACRRQGAGAGQIKKKKLSTSPRQNPSRRHGAAPPAKKKTSRFPKSPKLTRRRDVVTSSFCGGCVRRGLGAVPENRWPAQEKKFCFWCTPGVPPGPGQCAGKSPARPRKKILPFLGPE